MVTLRRWRRRLVADVHGREAKTARVGGSVDLDMINKNGKELSIFEAKRLTAILNEPDDIQMGRAAKAKVARSTRRWC
jgi:hypothetical protein